MKKLGLLFLAVLMISLSSCGGDTADKVKEAGKDAVETTKEVANDAVDATKEAANKTAEAVKETADKAVDAVKGVDGKALFDTNGCAACHNMTAKTVGPAVNTIAKSYAGKKDDMIKFFKGEGKAIVDPANFGTMQPQLNTTKKLSDAERAALADFVLSAK